MGARVQGERTAHRHEVLHRDLGRKGALGKSKRLMISVWFVNIWVQIGLISTLFCSLFQLCFLIFSTGSGVAQNVTQNQTVIISQVGKIVTLNCQYEISRNVHDYRIFWCQQLPSGEMTYLIHQYSEDGNERDGHYSVNFQKAQNSISLTISAL